MMLSDDELVLTVARAMYPNEPPVDLAELGPYHGAMCQRIARAVREALEAEPDDTEAAFFGPALTERVVRGRLVAIEHGGKPLLAPEDMEALTPPVTPLVPGEIVRLTDALYPDEYVEVVETYANGRRMFDIEGNTRRLFLDAAGVQALIDVARRWQAAQEGA